MLHVHSCSSWCSCVWCFMCILFMSAFRDVWHLHLLLNKNTQHFHACWLRRELPGEMRMQMVTVVGVTQRWSQTTLIYNQHQPVEYASLLIALPFTQWKKGVWWRNVADYALVTLQGIPHKSSHIHTHKILMVRIKLPLSSSSTWLSRRDKGSCTTWSLESGSGQILWLNLECIWRHQTGEFQPSEPTLFSFTPPNDWKYVGDFRLILV